MDNCPFRYIRKMEVYERIRHYYAIPTNEYINLHLECILKREGEKMIIKENKSELTD
jgi:hypothetical protein